MLPSRSPERLLSSSVVFFFSSLKNTIPRLPECSGMLNVERVRAASEAMAVSLSNRSGRLWRHLGFLKDTSRMPGPGAKASPRGNEPQLSPICAPGPPVAPRGWSTHGAWGRHKSKTAGIQKDFTHSQVFQHLWAPSTSGDFCSICFWPWRQPFAKGFSLGPLLVNTQQDQTERWPSVSLM